jgi:hypothetical protein
MAHLAAQFYPQSAFRSQFEGEGYEPVPRKRRQQSETKQYAHTSGFRERCAKGRGRFHFRWFSVRPIGCLCLRSFPGRFHVWCCELLATRRLEPNGDRDRLQERPCRSLHRGAELNPDRFSLYRIPGQSRQTGCAWQFGQPMTGQCFPPFGAYTRVRRTAPCCIGRHTISDLMMNAFWVGLSGSKLLVIALGHTKGAKPGPRARFVLRTRMPSPT